MFGQKSSKNLYEVFTRALRTIVLKVITEYKLINYFNYMIKYFELNAVLLKM